MARSTWLGITALILAGCNGLLQNNEVPTGVTDPALTQTPEGAMNAYNEARSFFNLAFGRGNTASRGGDNATSFVPLTGLMTDELQAGASLGQINILTTDPFLLGDRHDLPETNNSLPSVQAYQNLSRLRGQASQAIGLLTRYLPEQRGLAGHLYALQGYAEIFLAELFCSGIPLSTVDFDGDYTLRPGSSTDQVFTHALALFDTAIVLAGDSTRFVNLARVGQGRALLGAGRYADAAAAVATVPGDYRYEVLFLPVTSGNGSSSNFALVFNNGTWLSSVADHDGLNGLDYRSSGDPRTAATLLTSNNGFGYPVYRPNKYAPDGSSPVVVASGVEARLIEAEAAFHANAADGQWLATLNALRTDGTQDGGGVYNPGSGGVAGLAPLTDPGTDPARVDLLFRERAFWLFLTGHRQGDLRRLIRQYDRSPLDLYPTGPYPGQGFYGTDVTAPIPSQERELNPNFTGCLSRSA
jgi:hypothetical protein